MNASRLMNMVIRMVMRRVLSKGINAGMDKMSGGKDRSGPDGRKTAQRTRQTMKLGRRFGRF